MPTKTVHPSKCPAKAKSTVTKRAVPDDAGAPAEKKSAAAAPPVQAAIADAPATPPEAFGFYIMDDQSNRVMTLRVPVDRFTPEEQAELLREIERRSDDSREISVVDDGDKFMRRLAERLGLWRSDDDREDPADLRQYALCGDTIPGPLKGMIIGRSWA